MKKIRQLSLSQEAKKKLLLILICSACCVLFSMPTLFAWADQIANPEITIEVKDGKLDVEAFTVIKGDAKSILEQLDLGLGSYDFMNVELDDVLEDGDLLQIYRVSHDADSSQEVIEAETETHYDGLHLFTTTTVQEAQSGILQKNYDVVYMNGAEQERILVNEEVVSEPVNGVVSVGSVQVGAYFSGRLTTYGSDCYGCSGNTASGVNLNNLGGPTYTYKGQEYYILAADRSIPMYSIIKITNHNLGLPSTIYGIVLDRGGSIKGNKVDIYIGRENGERYFTGYTSFNTQFEIVSVGR